MSTVSQPKGRSRADTRHRATDKLSPQPREGGHGSVQGRKGGGTRCGEPEGIATRNPNRGEQLGLHTGSVSFTFVFCCFCYKLITKGLLLVAYSVPHGPSLGSLPPGLSVKLNDFVSLTGNILSCERLQQGGAWHMPSESSQSQELTATFTLPPHLPLSIL